MLKPSARECARPLLVEPVRCTAEMESGKFCDGDVPGGSPVSMCSVHLTQAYWFCEGLVDAALSAERSKSDRFVKRDLASERQLALRENRVVYYALIGRYIKIGTTAVLEKRMGELKTDALLATEPGWFDLEQHRHRQFSHLKARREDGRIGRSEYFEPGEDLLEHIDRLAEAEDALAA